MVEFLDMPDHLLKDCPTQLIPCPFPTKCKCDLRSFTRANSNSAKFPYHDQGIFDMKRGNDLLELLPKAVVMLVYHI